MILAEELGQEVGAAAMGEAIGLPGDEHIGDGVENAEAAPGDQDRARVTLFRYRIDNAAEQNGLDDGYGGENDVCEHNKGDTQPIGRKIFQGLEIYLYQGQSRLPQMSAQW